MRAAMRLALAACAALAAAPRLAAARTFEVNVTAGATVRLGFMTPAVKLHGNASANEFQAVMRLLEEDVNTGARSALLPNHTLEIVFADTTHDVYMAPYAFEELVDAGVAAVVGPTHYEEMALSSAFASTRFGVNQIGRSSAATALSDKTRYPFYSRLTGSFESEAGRLIKYLRETIGWNRFGVLAGIETGTVEFMDLFMEEAAAQGVEVVQPVQFPLAALESDETFAVYADLLKASGARVILTLLPSPDTNKALERMRVAGLMSSEYTLVLPSATHLEVADYTYPYIFDALIGSLFVTPVQFDVSPAAIVPFANRLSMAVFNEPFDFTSSPIDVYNTRIDYDSGLLAVQAVDALIQAKQACVGEVEGSTAVVACQALFADGSDDASLTRLIRSIPQLSNEAGVPVFLQPNGDRASTLTAVQLQGENTTDGTRVQEPTTGRSLYAVTHMVMPDGSIVPFNDALKFQDGTPNPPLDEAVVSYELEQVSVVTYAAMSSLAALASIFCVACVAGTFAYRKLPIMRMSSYRINCLSGVGGVVLLAPVFLGRLELSGALCTGKIWLTSVGFTLLFAPMFAKLWRVYRIFGQRQIRAVKVTDAQLFEVVALLLLLDALVVGAWNLAAPQSVARTTLPPEPTSNPNLLLSVLQEECDSSLDSVFYPLLIAAKAGLLVFGSFLAYRTREVKIKALNDAKWIGMSVYTTSLIALLTLPVVFLVGNDSADATYVLMSGPSVIIVATATALLFVPKLAAVANGSTDEWVKSEQAKTAMTQASAMSPRRAGASKATGGRSGAAGASGAKAAPSGGLHTPRGTRAALAAPRSPSSGAASGAGSPRLEMGTLRSSLDLPSSQPGSPVPAPQEQATANEV